MNFQQEASKYDENPTRDTLADVTGRLLLSGHAMEVAEEIHI